MLRLICTVRDCARPLAPSAGGAALRCGAGHAFDRAREGYWNLLQPQDRRSPRAGDRPEALAARGRWLERGFAVGLAGVVGRAAGLDLLEPGATLLDVGCGDGWFDRRWISGRELDLCGIDLSARALRLAARRLPECTWLVANADRGLPLAADSVDVAISLFGRRPASELARVVRRDGRLVVVVPGQDDLAELREAAQGRALARPRLPDVEREFAGTPFRASARDSWRARATHDRGAIEDALAMTYRGRRHRERGRLDERLGAEDRLLVTLAADLLVLKRER